MAVLSQDNILSLNLACPALAKSALGTVVRDLQNGYAIHRFPTANTSAAISAEISAIGSGCGTIHFNPGTWAISSSLTFPSNVMVVVELGAMLTKSGSGALAFNGPINAPNAQWLSGFAAGDVTFSSKIEACALWGGATGTGSAHDDTSGLQLLLSAFGSSGGAVRFPVPAVSYYVTDTLTCHQLVRLFGEVPQSIASGQGVVIQHNPATLGDCLSIAHSTPGSYVVSQIDHITFLGGANSRCGATVQHGWLHWHNVNFESFRNPLYIYDSINTVLDHCRFVGGASATHNVDLEAGTSIEFRGCYFSAGAVQLRIAGTTDVTLSGRTIFESNTGSAVIEADGCSLTLNDPYFENNSGALIKAGHTTQCGSINVRGGEFIGGGNGTAYAFDLDRVTAFRCRGVSRINHIVASLLHSTDNTGAVEFEIPKDYVIRGAVIARQDSHAYDIEDLILVVCSGETLPRGFVCTTAGTSAAAQPGGYSRTAGAVTDGTAVFRATDVVIPYDWTRTFLTYYGYLCYQNAAPRMAVQYDAGKWWAIETGYTIRPGEFRIMYEDVGHIYAAPLLYGSREDNKGAFHGYGLSEKVQMCANRGLEALGALFSTPLVTPTIQTVETIAGTIPAGTLSCRVSAVNDTGETLASLAVTHVLTEAGGLRSTWLPISGASKYRYYRGAYGSEEFVAEVTSDYATSPTVSYDDDGSITPSGVVPTRNDTADCEFSGSAKVGGSGQNVGFFGTTPIAKPEVTGSAGGNAALASLLAALENLGLITDSST